MTAAKTERNEALLAAYRAGGSIASVAADFGMSASNVYRILVANDATPDWTSTLARIAAGNRRKVSPEFRAKVSAGVTRWWAGKTGGNGPLTCTQARTLPVYGCCLSEIEAA